MTVQQAGHKPGLVYAEPCPTGQQVFPAKNPGGFLEQERRRRGPGEGLIAVGCDDDGIIGAFDLAVLLGAWGPCPP